MKRLKYYEWDYVECIAIDIFKMLINKYSNMAFIDLFENYYFEFFPKRLINFIDKEKSGYHAEYLFEIYENNQRYNPNCYTCLNCLNYNLNYCDFWDTKTNKNDYCAQHKN